MVGGVGVLLPLLEQMCEAEPVLNGGQEISDLLGPELTSSRGPAAMLLPLNKSSGEDRLSGTFNGLFRASSEWLHLHRFRHVDAISPNDQTLTQPLCFFRGNESEFSCGA